MKEAAENEKIVSTQFLVPGMDCLDCKARMEKAVRQMRGVTGASAVLAEKIINVEYDPAKTEAHHIISRIRSLGFEVQDRTELPGKSFLAQPAISTIRVSGMDCADCAAKIEKQIKTIPGVETADINFAAAKLTVGHKGPVTEILEAVKELGYHGQLEGAGTKERARVSFWRTNMFVPSTVISGTAIILAAVFGWFGLPAMFTHLIYTLAIFLGGYLPAKSGLLLLVKTRELGMNILMTIAVLGAIAINQPAEGAMVVFLFSLGNALQIYTLDKTRNSVRALMELTPKEALVSRNGREMVLTVKEIQIEDIVIVRPGERIPMDGQVTKGTSAVDQSPITGESLPVAKIPGDEVYAGTINERGSLEIKVTKLAGENTISKIIHLIEEAQGQRAPSQQFVDKFARCYTPSVILAAFLIAVVPPLFFGQPQYKWFYEALAALLTACPCALVISTPVSIASAIGSAARNGVLIKGGAYLEEMGTITAIAFDKTGTITRGEPQVTDVVPFNGSSENNILQISAAIESRSEHPLGRSIVVCAQKRSLDIPPVFNFMALPGKGAQGHVHNHQYYLGNTRLFMEKDVPLREAGATINKLQRAGKTTILLGDGEKVLGLIAVADVLRKDSRPAVERLKRIGVKNIVLLTGDNEQTARAIAAGAGIEEFKANLLPGDKVKAIQALLAERAKVAMVGDGVNDAPAMAISNVGIAMGMSGADTALETADIALMADDLSKLPFAVKLGRKTKKIIKQNIIFSLAIKGLILLLIIPGWLTLWLAVAGDMGSSLLVTLNGMRLLRAAHSRLKN